MARSAALVDVNTWLGAWPFQYFYEDRASRLQDLLEGEGVAHALVASAEAAFNPDVVEVNRRLVRALAGRKGLHPVMTVNPVLANARDLVRRYRDEGAAAIRLMPGYHVYGLGDAAALAVVEEIGRAGGPLLTIQMRIEDERTHHARCLIPGVPAGDVIALGTRFPELPVIAHCAYMHEAVEIANKTPNVHLDLSHVETMNTVPSLVKRAPVERMLFGSHAPFLYLKAMVMKITATAVPQETRVAIGSGNARRVLGAALRER